VQYIQLNMDNCSGYLKFHMTSTKCTNENHEFCKILCSYGIAHMSYCSGGAPNYFPNSFNGPADNRKYALSKTFVVSKI